MDRGVCPGSGGAGRREADELCSASQRWARESTATPS